MTERQRLDRWSLTDRITPTYESDMTEGRRLIALAMQELRAMHYDDEFLTYAMWELNRELPKVLRSLIWTPYNDHYLKAPCHAGLCALVRQLWCVSRAVTSDDVYQTGLQAIVTLHFTQIECGTPWDAHAMPILRLGATLAPSWIPIMAGRSPVSGLNYRQACIVEAIGDDVSNIINVRAKWDSVWHCGRQARMDSLVECFRDVFGIL